MAKRMSMNEIVEELSESFLNGNRSHVRDAILAMKKDLAVGVALRVYDSLYDPDDRYASSSFMRTMTDRL